MAMILKYITLLVFINSILCVSIKISHNKRHDNHLPYSVEINDLKNEGIFQRFLRHFLDLLSSDFPENKLVRYCRILGRELRNMDFKYTKDLAEHMRYLSRMYRTDLKEEMLSYRKELNQNLPYKKKFLKAMDEVFTLRENILFDDYIYDLRDYGYGDKLYINEETQKILRNVILQSIYKLAARDRIELENHLKRALKERQRVQNDMF